MSKTMSRTFHHSKKHFVASINPVMTNAQAKQATIDRALGILEDSPYYSRNMEDLRLRVIQGKVDATLARKIKPSIIAQVFRDARLSLSESHRLLRAVLPCV